MFTIYSPIHRARRAPIRLSSHAIRAVAVLVPLALAFLACNDAIAPFPQEGAPAALELSSFQHAGEPPRLGSRGKRHRLIDIGFGIPDWLRLVPVDSEADDDWRDRPAADLAQRYFAGRTDGLRPSSGESFLIATT